MLHTVGDVLQVAEHNPVVYHAIACRRHSRLSWEQAMMAAVCRLAEQNDRLLEAAVKAKRLEKPAPIIAENATCRNVERCPLCGQKRGETNADNR